VLRIWTGQSPQPPAPKLARPSPVRGAFLLDAGRNLDTSHARDLFSTLAKSPLRSMRAVRAVWQSKSLTLRAEATSVAPTTIAQVSRVGQATRSISPASTSRSDGWGCVFMLPGAWRSNIRQVSPWCTCNGAAGRTTDAQVLKDAERLIADGTSA
jgi:hypothetical protein